MANELNIGVRFGAEGIPDVTKSISQLDAQLKRFQKGLNTATGVDSIARLNRAIDVTKQRMEALRKFTGDAGAGISGGIVKGSNQAANALTNLSRVAQDAPFGFIGIQNNLNPLLESFDRLKRETGSSASAFKTLISSLAGPAGIGLALGVVTGLVTVAIQKYGSLGNALEALFGRINSLKLANEAMGKSFAEATGSVAGEQAVINSLVGIARNEALSREARSEAINKLNDEYDEFLPKLTLENINTQQVTDSVNKLNEALLRQAKIKGIQELISKEFERMARAMTDVNETSGFWTALRATITGFGNTTRTVTKAGEYAIKNQADAVADATKRIEQFNKVLNDLLTTEAVEGTLFTETQKKGTDALKARLSELERIKKVTKDITALTDIEQQIFDIKTKITLRDAVKNGLSKEEINLALIGLQQELQEAFNREVLAFEAIPKVKVTRVELAEIPSGAIESEIAKATGLDKKIPIQSDREVRIKLLGIEFVEAEEQAKAAVERLKDVILNSTTSALGDTANLFGESLGAIFSGEGLGTAISKAAEGLLRILGTALQQIGQQIIATSALVEVLKKALNNLFGPGGTTLGFAVGAALVGLGGLLKNLKLPGFAGGVNNFSGGLAIVGERGPELVNLPRGSDVIPNHMLGGSTVNVVLQPSLHFDRRGLVVAIQQVLESNSRMGGAAL